MGCPAWSAGWAGLAGLAAGLGRALGWAGWAGFDRKFRCFWFGWGGLASWWQAGTGPVLTESFDRKFCFIFGFGGAGLGLPGLVSWLGWAGWAGLAWAVLTESVERKFSFLLSILVVLAGWGLQSKTCAATHTILFILS